MRTLDRQMRAVIKVQGFPEGGSRERVLDLLGSVVQVCFGGDGHIPGNIFPFARVLHVTEELTARRCPYCDNDTAIYKIELEWESGARGEPGSHACEQCLMGVVVSGSQYIAFAEQAGHDGPVEVQMSYDLRSD